MVGIEQAIAAAVKDAPIAAVVITALLITYYIVKVVGVKFVATLQNFVEALACLKEAVEQLLDFMVRLNGRLTQATIDHVVDGEERRLEDRLTAEEIAALRMKIKAEDIAGEKRHKETK